jgi:uncharacterized membrane protein
MNKKGILEALAVFAGIGALDALYLTYEHYAGTIPPCTVGGCETVLTSSYATLAGFPISLLGALFYLSMITVAFILRKNNNRLLQKYVLASSTGAFVFSLYLFYLQAQVLGAFCQYCLVSFGTSTAVFVFSWLFILKKDNEAPILTS